MSDLSLSTKAGTRVKNFMRDLDMAEKTFYRLDPQPRSTKLRRARIVTESAREYVQRVAALSDERTR